MQAYIDSICSRSSPPTATAVRPTKSALLLQLHQQKRRHQLDEEAAHELALRTGQRKEWGLSSQKQRHSSSNAGRRAVQRSQRTMSLPPSSSFLLSTNAAPWLRRSPTSRLKRMPCPFGLPPTSPSQSQQPQQQNLATDSVRVWTPFSATAASAHTPRREHVKQQPVPFSSEHDSVLDTSSSPLGNSPWHPLFSNSPSPATSPLAFRWPVRQVKGKKDDEGTELKYDLLAETTKRLPVSLSSSSPRAVWATWHPSQQQQQQQSLPKGPSTQDKATSPARLAPSHVRASSAKAARSVVEAWQRCPSDTHRSSPTRRHSASVTVVPQLPHHHSRLRGTPSSLRDLHHSLVRHLQVRSRVAAAADAAAVAAVHPQSTKVKNSEGGEGEATAKAGATLADTTAAIVQLWRATCVLHRSLANERTSLCVNETVDEENGSGRGARCVKVVPWAPKDRRAVSTRAYLYMNEEVKQEGERDTRGCRCKDPLSV